MNRVNRAAGFPGVDSVGGRGDRIEVREIILNEGRSLYRIPT